MGFNTTATSVTLTAKLTPLGRQRLVSTNNALISSFSLGDSDANYNAAVALTTGQVPAEAGEVGPSSSVSNSTTSIVNFRSVLVVNGNGITKKPVESQSTKISSEVIANGQVTISGANLSQAIVHRSDYQTDSLVNLFYSFGLPLNSTQDIAFTSTTYSTGGYANTALSGIAQNNILVFGIKNSTYGEVIDGKTIKLVLPTTAATYTIYSTFQNKGLSTKIEDANIRDTSVVTSSIGNNIAFLFSDSIKTPNGGNGSLSWATGFNTIKPFSLNGKQLYNLQTDSNVSKTGDTMVGIAYLDKGFIVITHPTIVNNYGTLASSGVTANATVTFDSVSTAVYQNITCIAARGEFGLSTNPTFGAADVPRISDVGLYDAIGNLIAVAKTDRHITKNVNEFLALSLKISL